MMYFYQIRQTRSQIKERKITPSSIGNPGLCFAALVGHDLQMWKPPTESIPVTTLANKPVSPCLTQVLDNLDKNLIETAELGMYGRATLLFAEIAKLYGTEFRDVHLKVMSPIRAVDGKTTTEYAVVIIYMVSFISM